MTPQEHWRSLVLLGRFSQGNPADPPAEFMAGVEFGKTHRAEALPQTDLVACAETALLLAGKATPGPWTPDWGRIRDAHCNTICADPDPNWQVEGSRWLQTRDFIANARTSLPVLAQAVLDLTEKLEEARKAMLAALQHLGCDPCELTEALSRITPSQPKEGE